MLLGVLDPISAEMWLELQRRLATACSHVGMRAPIDGHGGRLSRRPTLCMGHVLSSQRKSSCARWGMASSMSRHMAAKHVSPSKRNSVHMAHCRVGSVLASRGNTVPRSPFRHANVPPEREADNPQGQARPLRSSYVRDDGPVAASVDSSKAVWQRRST